MDIAFIASLAKEHSIDAVHPGYGFLSESAEFVSQMWEKAGARVIGPGYEVLEKTGDKLRAKQIAQTCGIPLLPSTQKSTENVQDVGLFASKVGYPIMIKAVDGGGGRGIRLVRSESELHEAFDRTTGESPSGKVFAEKAATNGYHHIEVQIVGDGTGKVRHLWERDCSLQRRYQKIVEFAPAVMRDRTLASKVVEAALKVATFVRYCSLGTFEFLVNETTAEYYFLEINPRIQVEHTVTEQITSFDLVRAQLLLFQGLGLHDIGFGHEKNPMIAPNLVSIQLRLCAEDPEGNFALSMGKITEFHPPNGCGVRVDSHCSQHCPTIVGSDFDNLLAKVIITDSSWDGAVRKTNRALQDLTVGGVKSNIGLLLGIVESEAFRAREFDNQWLESNLSNLLEVGKKLRNVRKPAVEVVSSSTPPSAAHASHVLFRKGDAWSIDLSPMGQNALNQDLWHHLRFDKVLKNDFPNSIAGEIAYTISGSQGGSTMHYRLEAKSTQISASSFSSKHHRGDPHNIRHILAPISGKLIEVSVSTGDEIKESQVIAYIKQMKMELEVRSPRAGRVAWTLELEDEAGEDIAEGVLLAEVENSALKDAGPKLRGKL
ncbi:MAG: hypothetical protein M1822_001623 [Bathelium mastoideum]|nr:MAG: hypothetical protein M1822_001623 [Bathelium mastoideum]